MYNSSHFSWHRAISYFPLLCIQPNQCEGNGFIIHSKEQSDLLICQKKRASRRKLWVREHCPLCQTEHTGRTPVFTQLRMRGSPGWLSSGSACRNGSLRHFCLALSNPNAVSMARGKNRFLRWAAENQFPYEQNFKARTTTLSPMSSKAEKSKVCVQNYCVWHQK